jgi:hypothetical protein
MLWVQELGFRVQGSGIRFRLRRAVGERPHHPKGKKKRKIKETFAGTLPPRRTDAGLILRSSQQLN